MKGLTDTQRSVLRCLREHGWWRARGAGWYWDSESRTVRHMDALVKKGFATKDEDGTYRPTDKQEDAGG